VTVPGSKALGAKLATEEAKLSELEAEHVIASREQPKVMPHPALIARFVEDLLATLDTVVKATAVLKRTLRPFTLTPDDAGYKSPEPWTSQPTWAPESLKKSVAPARGERRL
jgi:hypothetical protein